MNPLIGRIPVLDVRPCVDCGRRPAKAVVGESFDVTATVFREGHEAVGANVVVRGPNGRGATWTPMRELAPGTDRWSATITPTVAGRWSYLVEAWGDPVTTWRRVARIKIPAGADTELVLAEGAGLHERAAAGVPKSKGRRDAVLEAADALRDTARPPAARLAAALSAEVRTVLGRYPLRELVTPSARLPLLVERRRALFGSWYEFFPRSEGARLAGTADDSTDTRSSAHATDRTGGHRTDGSGAHATDGSGARPAGAAPAGGQSAGPSHPPVSGTFRTAAERLPAIAAMGFDVVYLPPIHPIGTTFRKGRDNALTAGPGDVGVPWAVGSAAGGHDTVHPDLGSLDDFDAFVRRATDLRLEVALDFALQCSPDHPWVREHPEWFRRRADGSIAHAENPPKQYQDIYPICFEQDMPGLVAETLRVLRFWMDHGVRIFRVDNPHTKPVLFWEQIIADINRTDPDVIFLAEAFTRPALLKTLAAIGFQQSYTYFTWRNTKAELTEYLTELTGDTAAFLRPNFFVNTPDILHAYLQTGGRPAFEVRAVLAATLSPSWGVYSGFELCESTPRSAGSEEYSHAEKYELRPRDWAAAEREGRTITPLICALNRIRRRSPALQQLRNLHFHDTGDDAVICYSKTAAGAHGSNTVVVVANLDPHLVHETSVSLDMPRLGLDWHEPLLVRDELTNETYHWGRNNYVRLEPGRAPAHILTVLRPSPQIGGSPAHDRQ